MGAVCKFGLLGQHLSHSFSPKIHKLLAGYDYGLFEVEPEGLRDFLEREAGHGAGYAKERVSSSPAAGQAGERILSSLAAGYSNKGTADAPVPQSGSNGIIGMNVTIPYKKSVLPHLTRISDEARRIGSVNTLVRLPDGWHGYNTDYFGFQYMVEKTGYDIRGKRGLVLGSGGASAAVTKALNDMDAEFTVISRSGPDNYENLDKHTHAQFIVNATPVGMYPDNEKSPLSLSLFPHLEAVFDLIYNPALTALLLEAEERGLVYSNGLSMLVGQAARSAEYFLEALDPGKSPKIPNEKIDEVTEILRKETQNIILIGMPGSGKTLIGEKLAKKLSRPFLDLDIELKLRQGRSPSEIIKTDGEAAFRKLESELLREVGKLSGQVISTGGGAVTVLENKNSLHQNGAIIWLKRSLDKLETIDRPISAAKGIERLYAEREPLYAAFSDLEINNDGDNKDTVSHIMNALRL